MRARSAGSDEALRAAADLIDKSLLLRVDNSVVATCPLYHMLETVRAYAALELSVAGEHDDAMEGLVRYCTAEAALAAEGLVGPAQAEWLERVQEDCESYRAALTWLIERGRPDEASDIAWALMFFWMIRGHAAEGLRWYRRDSEPAVCSTRCRVESARRSSADVVHAGRTRVAHEPR